FEGPAHALPESLELLERRARDRDEGDIALRQMDREAIETVGPERAALAGRLPARVEHEMLDDQLVMAAEQIRQRLLAVRPVENILLIHPLPGQLAALAAELVAQPGELLLLGEEALARLGPFVMRDHVVLHHRRTPFRACFSFFVSARPDLSTCAWE